MAMKSSAKWVYLVTLGLLLAACAPGVNAQLNTPSAEGLVAGFWRGLWHGVISPITLVVSLFSHNVQMYEVHNNGGWYNFGFLLGVAISFGGGAVGRNSRRPKASA
jgi:hypothetical protein